MKKTISKHVAVVMVTSLLVLLLAGCGASKDKMSIGDGMTGGSVEMENNAVVDEGLADDMALDSTSNAAKEDRKIIETIELTVETKEFDQLISSIEQQITQLGGYVENSNIWGREMESYDMRSAEMTIRIPAEKSGDFSGYIAENSVVVRRAVNTEDVTLQYVDMESRVAALRAEKAALEKLLKNADKVEDIISVRDKLTDVIYEIESYESQLRTYDNLVSYATITIWIDEVERTTVVEKQNAWQKIGTNLKNNFANMWDGVVAVFVFAVSAIPYFIPFAVIAGVILLIIKLSKKKK